MIEPNLFIRWQRRTYFDGGNFSLVISSWVEVGEWAVCLSSLCTWDDIARLLIFPHFLKLVVGHLNNFDIVKVKPEKFFRLLYFNSVCKSRNLLQGVEI